MDNVLVGCKSMLEVEELKCQLSKEFDMKVLGVAKMILRAKIVRDRSNGFLFLSQRRYIEMVVKRFSMDNTKVISILGSQFLLSKEYFPQTKQEEEGIRGIPYTNAMGSHPDIAQVVSMVSRYMDNLKETTPLCNEVASSYLKGTSDVFL